MQRYTFTLADVLKWAEEYEGEPFHALLCDPPYHLTEITKRFGADDAAPAQFGSDGAFQRASRGFMGQTWDGGRVAFEPETWAALARHLYPGAFGMAFASSRGWHRMAVAIEDAGLIIHPVVMCWSFGSGFPKATKPADQYVAGKLREWLAEHPDEQAELTAARLGVRTAPAGETTAARENYQQAKLRMLQAAGLVTVVGKRKHAPKFAAADFGYREKDNGFNSKERETFDVIEYLDPIAAALAGHRYGLQALKPALEPVIVFQKSYQGRAVDCITRTGAGAINVDGGRIGTDEIAGGNGQLGRHGVFGAMQRDPATATMNVGRWPANLALVHHPACNGRCHHDCPVERLGRQSGESGGGTVRRNSETGRTAISTTAHNPRNPNLTDSLANFGDTGTAARYFYNADWMYERLELGDQVGYFAKASTAEREAGLDPMQIGILNQLDELDLDDLEETTVDDGRDTPIDNPYLRGETSRRNTHPTIKPLSLTRWLATLLLPPERYDPRRLLVPFAGTGSEMIGGILAGWEHVQGIELGETHERIAAARLAYWQARRHEFSDGRPITIKAAPKQQPADFTIFDFLADDAA